MPAKAVDQKFFALADPARLDIVRRLAKGPQTAGQLAEPYRISRPAISRHLRVLREAGITKAEVRGREWWYSIDTSGLQDAESWLDDVQKMWGAALQSLKDYVEAQDGR
jgi:DNA-binding transcriptional ArsR family regulator